MGVGNDKVVNNKSKVIRYGKSYRWRQIKREPYKKDPQGWASIERNVLIGREGDASSMHLRYFEIHRGGSSSLELHNHEHIVICIRGNGRIRLGDREIKVKPFDALYIAPMTVHQLKNKEDEPFGFFCIVKAKRDRPKVLHKPRRQQRESKETPFCQP